MQLIILLAWMVFNYFYIPSRPHQIILSDNLSLDNKLTYINFLVLPVVVKERSVLLVEVILE